MHEQLVATLLPILAKHTEDEFNIFNVMHHGTHEKQLSNVFAWLLNPDETHKLGDVFQQIFVSEVRAALGGQSVPSERYSVRQEINTADPATSKDIADIVLESEHAVLVIENYYTSSGHGHCHERYHDFGSRTGKTCVVVMLCRTVNAEELTDGWEKAAVIPYQKVVGRLLEHVENNAQYAQDYAPQLFFLRHLHSYSLQGREVNDDDLITFIGAMCASGEAGRYRATDVESATVGFGEALKERAMECFTNGRELLGRVKTKLTLYGDQVLKAQVNSALGDNSVSSVMADYRGIYQWTVNFRSEKGGDIVFQLKFGPSAWYANDRNDEDYWKTTVSRGVADYSRLFITRAQTKDVRQSAVSMLEVLDGLSADDYRLRDEIVSLMTGSDQTAGTASKNRSAETSPPFPMVPFPEELRRFVESAHWRLATTYAATWPHEYVVETSENAAALSALARHISAHGIEGRFYSDIRKYHHEDGKVNWFMEDDPEAATLINRCEASQTYEARLAAGTLPKLRSHTR